MLTLERICKILGYPRTIRVDQGSEFISRDLDIWAYQKGVVLDFSRPGKPTDNGFIESFNGKFRSECLNTHWFLSLDDARQKTEDWRRDYNEVRAPQRDRQQGADIAVEWLIGRPRRHEHNPANSSASWPSFGEHFSRSDLSKVIWHDGQGACLFTKKLERGRFVWPSLADCVVSISQAQISYLLSGIDWRNPQESWRSTSVG
ncbi:hypothetical protein ACVWXN_006745 [Bradyrhizobium sp. i1.4.4]